MRTRSRRLEGPRYAAALIALFLVATARPQAQNSPTPADYISPAYPVELAAAAKADRIAWIAYDEGKRNVYSAAAPAYTPVRLTSFMKDDGVDLTDVKISDDGSVVTFVRGHAYNRDNWVANPSSDPAGAERAVWTVRTSGGGAARRLAAIDRGSPQLAPDGSAVLFVKNGQIHRARTAAVAGAAADGDKPYFTVWGTNSNPIWSPDSTRIAFVSDRVDHAFIGVYDVAAKKITYLAPNVDRDSAPTWSPDGRKVAFLRRPGLPFGQQGQTGIGGVGNPPGPAAQQGRQGGQGRGGGQGAANPNIPAAAQRIPGLTRAAFRGGYTLAFWVADAATGDGHEFWHAQPDDPVFSNVTNFTWAGGHVVFSAVQPNDEWDRFFSVPVTDALSTAGPALLTSTHGLIEDTTSWRISPDGRTFFYTSNAGDIDRRDIWAVPVAGGTPRQVTKGDGIETMPTPVASGRHVAIFYADAKRPQSVAIVQASGGEERILFPNPLPARFPIAAHVVPTAVTLKAADGFEFYNQLFLPKDLKPGEKRPAVIFVHGGPVRQMLLGYHYRHFYHMAYAFDQYLVNQGYVVLSVNYRSGVGYGRSFRNAPNRGGAGNAEYGDVLAAGQYLQSRADVDPDRIGIWGLSYGGVLTAQALARNSDIFKVGVDLAGVHLWGSSLDPESVSFKSSAIGAIDTWKSPVLLLHGDDDRNVAFQQTTGLVQLLRARDVPYELIVFPDDVHDSLIHRRWIYTFERADQFLRKYLMPTGGTAQR